MILNLGCGELPIKDAVNVDLMEGTHVDEIIDLRALPWKWNDDSIEGIYMLHVLEHFPDATIILKECHRILKRGGFLYLQVPHSTNCSSVGNLEHCRTFSVSTFDENLCYSNHLFNIPLFKTVIKEVRWWGIPRNQNHPYVKFSVQMKASNSALYFLIKPVAWFMQKVINVSPRAFERFWCYWVGGADEVIWKGIKI